MILRLNLLQTDRQTDRQTDTNNRQAAVKRSFSCVINRYQTSLCKYVCLRKGVFFFTRKKAERHPNKRLGLKPVGLVLIC